MGEVEGKVAVKPKLRILHNLARCGGTVISRCLGCMDGIVLLSEVHPTYTVSFNDPSQQARDWHGIEIPSGLPWIEAISETGYQASRQGKHLVLRSWDHVDFIPSSHNPKPGLRSLIVDALQDRFDLLRVAITRSSISQHISLTHFGESCSTEDFLRGHAEYARLNVPQVAYEDYRQEPERALQRICDALELRYDEGWRHRWQNYWNVTGDVAARLGR